MEGHLHKGHRHRTDCHQPEIQFLGGLHVYDQLELRGLFNRYIARFVALETARRPNGADACTRVRCGVLLESTSAIPPLLYREGRLYLQHVLRALQK